MTRGEIVRAGVVRAGEYALTRLATGIVEFFLEEESLTRESLTLLTETLVRGLGKKHVMGRVGKPHEIGQTILFLADTERSSFMTGQALIVDGGATARLSTE